VTARVASRLSRAVAAALTAAGIAVLVVHVLAGDAGHVTPSSLAVSVAHATGAATPGHCFRGRGTWICPVPGHDATYLVTVLDARCWRAHLAGDAPGLPENPSGCVARAGRGG